MLRPKEDPGSWFNVFVLHQNRYCQILMPLRLIYFIVKQSLIETGLQRKLKLQLPFWTSSSQILLSLGKTQFIFYSFSQQNTALGPCQSRYSRMKSQLPIRTIYLSWTTGQHIFHAQIILIPKGVQRDIIPRNEVHDDNLLVIVAIAFLL